MVGFTKHSTLLTPVQIKSQDMARVHTQKLRTWEALPGQVGRWL